jgi:hypothetical protein
VSEKADPTASAVDAPDTDEARAAAASTDAAPAEVQEPPAEAEREPDADEVQVIDVIPDDLALARAQLDAGLAPLAEGHLRIRIARLEAEGASAADELDAARCLLAESLWRQQRPIAAGAVLDAIRPGSLERRRPIAMLIEAEARAAVGDPDRARALMEEVVSAVGVERAWVLRGGMPTRLSWPLPPMLRPPGRRGPPAPGSTGPASFTSAAPQPRPERTAAAHARVEAARRAYRIDDVAAGDRELGVALRLDPAVAAEGVSLIEPTIDSQTATDRLLLYGDLLRAAGRDADASAMYDRAARA